MTNFLDRDEVLEIVERDGEMMDYFVSSGVMGRCPFLESHLDLDVSLGKGAYGSVFKIRTQRRDETYAVKRVKSRTYQVKEEVWSLPKANLRDILSYLKFSIDGPLNEDLFHMLNKGNALKSGDRYLIPIVKISPCKLTTPVSVEVYTIDQPHQGDPHDRTRIRLTGDTFTIPSGSYMCDYPNYTEYPISVLCTHLLLEGECINFLDVFGFSMCANDKMIYDYTFMEAVDGSLKDILRQKKFPITENIVDSIYIQVVFAICSMQRLIGIQHNDLHCGNVLLKILSNSDTLTRFNGKELQRMEFFKYTLDGTHIYLPNDDVIAKVSDFGLSAKYSEPMMMNRKNQNLAPLPGWKSDSYDFLFFTASMYHYFGGVSRLVSNMMGTIVNPYHPASLTTVADAHKRARDAMRIHGSKYFLPNLRPNLNELPKKPWDYLTDMVIMNRFIHRPARSSVDNAVQLGTLDSHYTISAKSSSTSSSSSSSSSSRTKKSSTSKRSPPRSLKKTSKKTRRSSPHQPIKIVVDPPHPLPPHLTLIDDD